MRRSKLKKPTSGPRVQKAIPKSEQAGDDKRANAAAKKAERDALLAEEEATQRATPKAAGAKTATKKNKGLDLSQLDSEPSTGKTDSKTAALSATGIENAIDALGLTGGDAMKAKVDRHPERRFKAAYAAFEAKRMPEIEQENPGLRKNQREQICRKEFEKSEENPFNQVHGAFDMSKDELSRIRDNEREKLENSALGHRVGRVTWRRISCEFSEAGYTQLAREAKIVGYLPLNEKPTLLTFLDERDSGIDWMWALPAIELLLDAKTLASEPLVFHRAEHIRRLSLDAVTYLLKSLPANLTNEERVRIAESLPNKLELKVSGIQLEDGNGTDPTRMLQFEDHQSLFRRLIAHLLVLIAFAATMIIPYILSGVQWIYRQERRYRITDRMLFVILRAVDAYGQRCWNIKNSLVAYRHGRIGSSVDATIAYIVDGFVGGLRDGVSRGMPVVADALMD
ncbi:MAG: hypothetical protein Q9160_002242 [Pyrenula sp. 1 TL-2023]